VRTVWVSRARRVLLAGALVTVIVQPIEQGHAQSAPNRGAARGDAARGERLFATLPCASCHDVTHPWPGGDVCPNLGNIATEAARIVRSGDYHGKARGAAEYIRESIVDPNAYIVPGANYRTAPGQSVMPKDFGQTLTPAQLEDLVAFLMTRR
jgi:nitric oxide reductase subunit C